MAELQIVMDHAIGLIFFGQPYDIIQAFFIRGKNRRSGYSYSGPRWLLSVHSTPPETGFTRSLKKRVPVHDSSQTTTAPDVSMRWWSFQLGMAMGLPEIRMRGALAGATPYLPPRAYPVHRRGGEHLGITLGVIIKRNLGSQQSIFTADGHRAVLAQVI